VLINGNACWQPKEWYISSLAPPVQKVSWLVEQVRTEGKENTNLQSKIFPSIAPEKKVEYCMELNCFELHSFCTGNFVNVLVSCALWPTVRRLILMTIPIYPCYAYPSLFPIFFSWRAALL